jgi:hypothetical protein
VEKVDFKKEMAQLYAPKNNDWQLIEVPIIAYASQHSLKTCLWRGALSLADRRGSRV